MEHLDAAMSVPATQSETDEAVGNIPAPRTMRTSRQGSPTRTWN